MSAFENQINELVEKNMTEEGKTFWREIRNKIPPVWDRYSSSTMKYHRRKDGTVPSIEEHTLEMLKSGCNVMGAFNIQPKTKDCDLLMFAILLHDAFKYGTKNPLNSPHTDNTHDSIVGNVIKNNNEMFHQLFEKEKVVLLEEIVRYHSGRWSTDVKDKDSFNFKDFDPLTMFVHLLDMLSSRDCLKI